MTRPALPSTNQALVNPATGTITPEWQTFFATMINLQQNLVSTNYLYTNKTAQVTVGYTQGSPSATSLSSGTYTPDPTGPDLVPLTNSGAHTLAAPTNADSFTMGILYTNGSGAGTITLSGFTFTDGDPFDTTSGHKFLVSIIKIGSDTYANVKALQ